MDLPLNSTITNSTNGTYSINQEKLVIYDNGNNALITPGSKVDLYLELTSMQEDFKVSFLELNGIQMNLSGETTEPTGIRINEENIEMYPDQTKDLTVTFEPYNGKGTVIWSSSDSTIASITSDTGVLTTVAPGRCVITARCGNLTATCDVKVLKTVVQTANLEIKFTGGNSWPANNSFFNVQYSVSVKNISTESITGWECDIVLPAGSSYNTGWNATVTNPTGTTYHIVGMNNNPIAPGTSVSDVGMILIVPSASYVPIPTNIKP